MTRGRRIGGKPEKKSSFPGPDDMINRPEIGQHRTMYPESEEEALAALKGDDPTLAATAEAFLWRIWCRSADAEAGRIFRDGVEAMQRRQLAEAEALFSRVIERDPDFAEGWNKRATVRFLRKDFQGAIADCRQTLARNRSHFAGASGHGGGAPRLRACAAAVAGRWCCSLWGSDFRGAAFCFRRAREFHPLLAGARHNLA